MIHEDKEPSQAEISLFEAIGKAVVYHMMEYKLTLYQVLGILESYKMSTHNRNVDDAPEDE